MFAAVDDAAVDSTVPAEQANFNIYSYIFFPYHRCENLPTVWEASLPSVPVSQPEQRASSPSNISLCIFPVATCTAE